MAGKAATGRRRSLRAPAPEGADPDAQHSAKKAKKAREMPACAAAGAEAREERFLLKLAKALGDRASDESAALRTASAVKEALRVAVGALPEGKALKTKLQDGLDEYSVLLAKYLDISEPSSSAPAATPADKPAPATATGKCALVLDSVYDHQLSKLQPSNATALLLARAPAPLEVVRLALGPKASEPLEALKSSLCLWSCLTPAGPADGQSNSLWLAGAAELAEDALRAAVDGKAEAKEVMKALVQFFAGQAVRRRRSRALAATTTEDIPKHASVCKGSSDPTSGKGSAGRLVLLHAQAVALDTGITDSAWPGSGDVSAAVAFDLAAIGPRAWDELADYLLSPDHSLVVSEGRSDAHRIESALWQALHAGMETEQARQTSLRGCASLIAGGWSRGNPGTFLRRVLLGKRTLGTQRAARTSPSAGPGEAVLKAAVPNELCAWLETQPLNKAVSMCLSVLRKHPEGLTPHLVLSATERDVKDLLAAWEKSAASAAAEVGAADDSSGLEAVVGTDDALFFVDTSGQDLSGLHGDDDYSSSDGDDPEDEGRDGGVEELMQGTDGASDSGDGEVSEAEEDKNNQSSSDDDQVN